MAKISQLPALDNPTGSERVPVIDEAGVTRGASIRRLSEAAVKPLVSDAQAAARAAANTVSALSKPRVFGRPVDPAAGLNASAGAFVYATPFPVTTTLNSIKAFGGSSGGTLTIQRWTKSSTAMAAIGSPVSVVIAPDVLNDLPIDMPIEKGEYIGVSAAAGVFAYVAGSADEGGHYSAAAGATSFTAGTPSTSNRLQLQFGYKALGVTIAEIDQTRSDVAALNEAAPATAAAVDAVSQVTTSVLGRTGKPVAGTNAGVGSYVLSTPAAMSGKIKRVRVWSQVATTLSLRVFDKSGDNFTLSGAAVDVPVKVGLNELLASNGDFIAKDIAAGQYAGFYSPVAGGFAYTTTSTDTTSWYSGGNGSFVDAAVSNGQRLEYSLTIERSDVVQVAQKLAELEGQGSGTGSRSGGVFSHALNFINNTGESLSAGNPAGTAITTEQEYDNVGFPAHAPAPAALVPLTVAGTQLNATGESPMYGALGHMKALVAGENGLAPADLKYQLATANNGYPGYTLVQISKGQQAFTDAMAQTQAIKSIATEAGLTYSYQATLLTIGVNDTAQTTSKAPFKAQLLKLADDYAADAKAITGQYNDPIMLISQVSTAAYRDISEAQMEAGQEHGLIRVVAPLYPFAWTNAQHIDGPSTKLLGGYYGIALKRMLVDKTEFEPLQPVRHAISGNVIDLFFSKRGLVLDTTQVPQQANYGFSVFNAAGASQAISSVTIIAPDRVRITLSAPATAGWQVRYGYLSAVGIANYTGAAGNLRDSQGDRLKYLGTPMHNWCLLFRYQV
jgi:hypothetical protein